MLVLGEVTAKHWFPVEGLDEMSIHWGFLKLLSLQHFREFTIQWCDAHLRMEANSIDLEDTDLDCGCCFCQIRCIEQSNSELVLRVAAVTDRSSSWSLRLPKLFCLHWRKCKNIRGALLLVVLLIRKAKDHFSGLRCWCAGWFKSCLAFSCSAPLSPLQFFC